MAIKKRYPKPDKGRKNYGYGSNINKAVHVALTDHYKSGSTVSRDSTEAKFLVFITFIQLMDVVDLRQVKQEHINEFGLFIAMRVNNESMSIAYAQNCLSAVNITFKAILKNKFESISPVKYVGKRSSRRTTLPKGSWIQVHAARQQAEAENNHRGSALLFLIRAFGLRLREACLCNLERIKKEASATGFVQISDGTKGGRKSERKIKIGMLQLTALNFAYLQKPINSQNLIKPEENMKSFIANVIRPLRQTIKNNSIPNFRDLRCAFLIDLYEEVTGMDAPVKGYTCDPEQHKKGCEAVAYAAGHNRIYVAESYVGSPKK
jgi:site-specific recombinase XerD